MEMNPQRVRSAEFKTVRKGADPDEVRVFLDDVATELERAQNQATAMEARARAAVARLQEINESPAEAPAPAVDASVEESETISRTLLLAQRTADGTIAEAKSSAAKLIADANDEAARTRDSTREMAAQMVESAQVEARQIGAAERASIAEEVEALKARRDFLESDVHHLETFLADQRARVREAASSLIELSERVPGGLGAARAPLLSASDDDDDDAVDDVDGASKEAVDGEEVDELVIMTDIAADGETGESTDDADESGDQVAGADGETDGGRTLDQDPWADSGRVDDPTQAITVVGDEAGGADDDEFRFSFDDERS